MATVALVTDKNGTETIFASVELAKKSIEFSCHKFADVVTYAECWEGGSFEIQARCPDGQVIKIEEVHVHDRVTHI